MQSNKFTKVKTSMKNIATTENEKSAITLTTVIYALYAASYFVGITAIIAIVMNYVKKDDVVGTFLESHFRWQIRTFWFGVLWGVLGTITMVFIIGWFVLVADGIWIIYRIVKGWLRLNDGKPMYTV
ncbi:transmembrane protein [Methylobacter tundripaludum SV96]|uniref:Transmembrane protein n=2 Tax=Methylobacter tundripaludum TaxID=173365 RepID=G3IYF2_METTV|nr:transmembrane protein [Methylobacter tundripaludum SV96]